MKILVDKMPEEPYDCSYCKDESDMDNYICKWNGSNRVCYNTTDCPFFRGVADIISNFTYYAVDGALDLHEMLFH